MTTGMNQDLCSLARLPSPGREIRQCLSIQGSHVGIEADQTHLIEGIPTRLECRHGHNDNHRCPFRRKGIGTRRDGRKGNGPGAGGTRNLQGPPVGGREQMVFVATPPLPDRTNSVDHPSCWQTIGPGQPGLSGLTSAECPAFGHKARSGGTVNGSVHPAPAQQ
ncbi:MAG: hypothetical protein FD153_295 [Rhodospirillaceae bacterium]|nr:MAG: hypothetical protein FD153_295 [Rhodospirillaceae bacterium]